MSDQPHRRQGRIEDYRLTTGQGRYTDDLRVDDALWAVFVRSPYAAAGIGEIDLDEARDMPGVVAIYTAADLEADGVGPVQTPMALEGPDGRKWTATDRPLLAAKEARFVGEPIAMVVADTREAAMDAAEMVMPDLEEREPIVTVADATNNLAAVAPSGTPTDSVGFQQHHFVTTLTQLKGGIYPGKATTHDHNIGGFGAL